MKRLDNPALIDYTGYEGKEQEKPRKETKLSNGKELDKKIRKQTD